jgi:signal transduction histidine kinase
VFSIDQSHKEKIDTNILNVIRQMKVEERILAKIENCKKLVEFSKMTFKNKNQVLILIKDITNIKKEQQQISRQKMQTLLLASITHDLRTPLNSALAFN